MKRILLPLLFTTVLLANASCSSDEEVLQTTIVQGRAINPNTAQPEAGVSIIVRRFTSGGFINPDVSSLDSITGAQTDAAGRYSLSFGAKKTGTYEVTLARLDKYYDLENGYDGRLEAHPGKTNNFNFKVTPYKLATVNVHTSKNGKTALNYYYGGAKIAFGTTIFSDTTRTNQSIAFTKIIKVVPNQEYQFCKFTYNQVRTANGNYDIRDQSHICSLRKIGYNDTTVVNLN